MKKKKGFSLVELLAVIIILSTILIIAVPTIGKLLHKNKVKSFNSKMNTILKQAKVYATDVKDFLYNSNKKYNGYVCNVVTVGELKTLGYLEELSREDGSKSTITDPRNNSSMENIKIMVYIKNSGTDNLYYGSIISTTKNVGLCGNYSGVFSYTGKEQTFTAPQAGRYKIEVWGASGGQSTASIPSGYGAYAYGEIELEANEVLYINVGGEGSVTTQLNKLAYGGYNGGGVATQTYTDCNNQYSGTGGGATSVALKSGLLKSLSNDVNKVVIVAAGGGGSINCSTNNTYNVGGSGGGISGVNVDQTNGGTQTAGGCRNNNKNCSKFGTANEPGSAVPSSGGGGGFYGGAGGERRGGAGGSSYIGNSRLTNKGMYCYNCTTSTNAETLTSATTCTSKSPEAACAKKGSGYVKITNLDALDDSTSQTITYSGQPRAYTVPVTGKYKIELWGAQGGSVSDASGGKGAYTSGIISLNQNDVLYFYVGGAGSSTAAGTAASTQGGYNGGGGTGGQDCCSRMFGTCGGATDVRLVGGAWNDFTSLASRIMVAAGGGGAYNGDNYGWKSNAGGYGGTLTGGNGAQGSDRWCYGLGASQTSGGAATTDCSQTHAGTPTGGFGYGGGSGDPASGGGGGYYGGGRSHHIASAGGGSSYVSGYVGCDAISSSSTQDNIVHTGQPNHSSGKVFTEPKMIAGNQNMPKAIGSGTTVGNNGNGAARITLVEY